MGPENGEVASKMLSSTQAAGLTCLQGIHPEGNREGLENRQGVWGQGLSLDARDVRLFLRAEKSERSLLLAHVSG